MNKGKLGDHVSLIVLSSKNDFRNSMSWSDYCKSYKGRMGLVRGKLSNGLVSRIYRR